MAERLHSRRQDVETGGPHQEGEAVEDTGTVVGADLDNRRPGRCLVVDDHVRAGDGRAT